MANPEDYWAAPHPDGGWQVRREGNEQATERFDTQDEAWERAKELARGTKGEAYLQSEDGTIRERNTYGHDPVRTKG